MFGQAVQVTATVTPAAATGSVQFFEGATILGTVAVSNGTAVLSVPSFSAGTHSVGAAYLGDATYAGANSANVTVTVTKATPSISVSSSQNPAPNGQAVTFTIALTPATTTGSVQLLDGSTVLANLGVGTTTASVTFAVGLHSVTAVYSGDANFNGATSAAVSQLATTTTTTTVSADLPNSTYGQTVRLTAAVTPAPTGGTVQFLDGSTALGIVAVQSGAASLTVSTLSVGTHAITAVYSSDGAGYLGSTSAVFTETVGKTATVSDAGRISQSRDGGPGCHVERRGLTGGLPPARCSFWMARLCSAQFTLSNGAAMLSISALAAGSHSLTVIYSGDATNSPSTSAVFTETVNKAATTASLTSSPNPSVSGQAVTFTAQVSPSAATGSVQFKDGATLLGTVTVSGGSASLAVSSLSVGTHSITAIYSGDGNYTGSTSNCRDTDRDGRNPGRAFQSDRERRPHPARSISPGPASPTGGVTYNVYSSTTSGFTPSAGNRIATGVTVTSYSHTGLAPSTVHYYKVTAQNSAGESAQSNQAGATTQAAGVSCHVGLHRDHAMERRLRHRHHHQEHREHGDQRLESHLDLGRQPADHAGLEFQLHADRQECIADQCQLESDHRPRRDAQRNGLQRQL